jgi:hypothetical protein
LAGSVGWKIRPQDLLGVGELTVDVRIAKVFFQPTNAVASGITMELSVPFLSVYFPAIGNPSSFNDAGQTDTNDGVIALDPGSIVPPFLPIISTHDCARGDSAGWLVSRLRSSFAFGRRCIPLCCVAPPLHTPGMLGRRALPSGRLAALGATTNF